MYKTAVWKTWNNVHGWSHASCEGVRFKTTSLCWQSVRFHARLSRAMDLLLVCCSWRCSAPFSWLLLDLLPVRQTSYRQVSEQLVKSMSNGENMNNLTALFTFGTNLMHASPRIYGILVFFQAFFYKFMLFKFWVKDAMGTINHAHITEASPDPVKAYTCRSHPTSNRIFWVCQLNCEKFEI